MEEKKIKLLLVEDDRVDQMAFERCVKKNNLSYDYIIAGSVAAAKKIVQSHTFDIIISDYLLGDGLSFELFDFFGTTPVIVATGSGNEEVAVEALKLGAYDYLIKDPEGNYLKILPATVNLALQRKQNEEKLESYHNQLESMVRERTAALQAEIVERKSTEAALLVSENRFRDIVQSMADCIWEVDNNFVFTYLSETVIECIGYSPSELIGTSFFAHCLTQERDKVKRHFSELMAKAEPVIDFESSHLTKDGSQVLLFTNGVPIVGGAGEVLGYRGINKDITQQKILEEKNRAIEAKLQRTQKMESIGTLAGGIAHDFNNILAAIIGYTEMALDDVKEPIINRSALEGDLQKIYTAGLRAKELVKQILTFARHSDEAIAPIRVDYIVREVSKFIRATIPANIEIKEEIRSQATILGSQVKIHQILMNLYTNAAHAMEENGGVLRATVNDCPQNSRELSEHPQLMNKDHLKIVVSDTGKGIPPGDRALIFDPYFTTKATGDGTGLGLAMVHGVVESYGGTITVTSELHKGSIFTIYLPITNEQIELAATKEKALPLGTERILLVDDEPSIVSLNQTILGRLGYHVTVLTSSVQALEQITSHPHDFDLLISDVTMPKLTGDKLAQALMDIRADLPVILCTGYSKKLSTSSVTDCNIKAVLDKPTLKSDLAHAVRQVLDGQVLG